MTVAGSPFSVQMTRGAERDLESIYDYVAEMDCVENANRLLDGFADVVESLSKFPERGSHPSVLLDLGIKDYRQVCFKPYRLIYRVTGRKVIIYLIVDSRRDLQSLLTRRLLDK